jgi:hypothetical protein
MITRFCLAFVTCLVAAVFTPARADGARLHCHRGYHAVRRHSHWRCVRNHHFAMPPYVGIGGGDGQLPPTTQLPPPASNVPALIVTATEVDRVEALDPGIVGQYFNRPSTIETGSPYYSAWTPYATTSASFNDENQLEAAVADGTLPPGTRSIHYDAEQWSFTPLAQQQDPATYYRRAAQAAHSVGLPLVATPGTDLANVTEPGSTPAWQRYLDSGIAAAAARYADVYEVQSQTIQGDLASYSAYVHAAAAQARAANPGVEVLAGLTTNHAGVEYSADQMLAAAKASSDVVSGWWINDTPGGARCPGCIGPFPQTVVAFLREGGKL